MIAFTTTFTDGIARVVFDLQGEKVNKFSAVVMAELGQVLDELHARTDLKAVLFTSGKPGIFIAGAEIKEIQGIANRVDAQAKADAGQRTFQKVADLKVPTIAVIDGACLGGGLEFALACTYRIVADEEKTKLGLLRILNTQLIGIMLVTHVLPRLLAHVLAITILLKLHFSIKKLMIARFFTITKTVKLLNLK